MVDKIKELIESVLIAVVLAFFIMTFVMQSYVVQGHSMDNTLEDGERLFINKFIYRFHPPKRGDVVVIRPKGRPKQRYIKRVIGLPGDQLLISKGRLYINNKEIKEEYIKEEMLGDYGPHRIPKGHVFVMGDNRNNSADSRVERLVGDVSYDRVIGKAFWSYWPITDIRIIDGAEYPELNI